MCGSNFKLVENEIFTARGNAHNYFSFQFVYMYTHMFWIYRTNPYTHANTAYLCESSEKLGWKMLWFCAEHLRAQSIDMVFVCCCGRTQFIPIAAISILFNPYAFSPDNSFTQCLLFAMRIFDEAKFKYHSLFFHRVFFIHMIFLGAVQISM